MNHKEYRDLIRSRREQIRKGKAQAELRMDTIVRDNKNIFFHIY